VFPINEGILSNPAKGCYQGLGAQIITSAFISNQFKRRGTQRVFFAEFIYLWDRLPV